MTMEAGCSYEAIFHFQRKDEKLPRDFSMFVPMKHDVIESLIE